MPVKSQGQAHGQEQEASPPTGSGAGSENDDGDNGNIGGAPGGNEGGAREDLHAEMSEGRALAGYPNPQYPSVDTFELDNRQEEIETLKVGAGVALKAKHTKHLTILSNPPT